MTALLAPDLAQGVLEVERLTKRYGGITAVDAVSLQVAPGRVTSLIGPNGAGKTTLFNCLTGVHAVSAGRVLMDGQDITAMPMHRRAQLGIGRTFQQLEVFAGMTVEGNLLVAAESMARHRRHLGTSGRAGAREVTDQVLETIGLTASRRTLAGALPTGTLRLLELGRALCIQPRVLLLDEPGSGLDTHESEVLADILRGVVASGIGVLLVEHDVELVMAISERIYVLDFGQLIATGTPAEIADNDDVRRAYLGVDA
ncbi:MAG: Sulfate-transporting ATPase [Frankiales bacterium]|nr:Sulfate-transporting ATPase [Frankiales bacterium]